MLIVSPKLSQAPEKQSVSFCICFLVLALRAQSSADRRSVMIDSFTFVTACRHMGLNNLHSVLYLIGIPSSRSWKASDSIADNIMLIGFGWVRSLVSRHSSPGRDPNLLLHPVPSPHHAMHGIDGRVQWTCWGSQISPVVCLLWCCPSGFSHPMIREASPSSFVIGFFTIFNARRDPGSPLMQTRAAIWSRVWLGHLLQPLPGWRWAELVLKRGS